MSKQSKSSRILDILAAKYPDRQMPHGTLALVGAGVGCTSEYVRQVAGANGYVTTVLGSNVCLGCGGRKGWTSKQCMGCVRQEDARTWAIFPCLVCGVDVRRRKSQRQWRIGRPHRLTDGRVTTYTGRVFCSRACYGKWFGKKYGWGSPDHPRWQARRKELAAAVT